MGVESDFLKRLFEFGLSNGTHGKPGIPVEPYFKTCPIQRIENSCCTNATTEVIDFDRTKDIVALKNAWQTPKSCDALQINSIKLKISFIEFKGWQNFITRQSGITESIIQAQIDKFDLETKITDSLVILHSILLDKRLILTKEERRIYNRTPKYFLIVVDLPSNPLKKLAITLEALATTSDISTKIQMLLEQKTDELGIEMLHSLQEVKLVNCENIDKYLL